MEGKGGCGREREKRGQGCFLFSQLIDSQMSAVGFVVVVKHSGILFPPKNKQKKTRMSTYKGTACVLHLSSSVMSLVIEKSSQGITLIMTCSRLHIDSSAVIQLLQQHLEVVNS